VLKLIEGCEIVQNLPDIGMISGNRLLAQRECAPEERFGLMS